MTEFEETIAYVDRHGRMIELLVNERVDACGQFEIRLVVDDTERYRAHFTDKSAEEPPEPKNPRRSEG